ncbi:transporter substrate-binding domain-containing protein [Variovorax sp. ZT5P49]|uniref:transporter substrate-binding domain-containing protein n=1 Tax=Variovorax sp. ZT5P49 TaxID=3443733 RepID=UPI003F479D5E
MPVELLRSSQLRFEAPPPVFGDHMKSSGKLIAALFALPLALLAGTVRADQLTDIKARGTLVCGVLANFEPFGFQDSTSREIAGYDIDYCNGVAKALGVKPTLQVVSMDARIPELLQGRVDVLAAVLGYSPARAEQIAFTNQYYVAKQVISVKTGGPFKVRDDLDGKRVSTIKGSSNIAIMGQVMPTVQLVSYDDSPSAFLAMVQGKVNGFVVTEPIMHRFAAKLGQNINVEALSPPVGREYWGLGIKKSEPALLDAVNNALSGMEKSGEAQQIFDKWLGAKTIYRMQRDFKSAPIKG